MPDLSLHAEGDPAARIEAARSGLYGLALRLQRAPMLGPLMRAMPQGLRFRIKRLLSR